MTKNISVIGDGKIRLHSVATDKFKISRFSINFITKSDKYNTPLAKLMLAVMLRGSEKYPTVTSINKALDEQYGATVSLRSSAVGNKTVHSISCKLLKDSFVFDGDDSDILDSVLAILSDVLFNPLKDANGLLLSSYIESEKKIATDQINAKINDPKAYASEQCSRCMFEGSDYAVVTDGDCDLINSFTAQTLTEHIYRFFKGCRIECFYVGNKPHGSVKKLLEKYFAFGNIYDREIEYGESPFERKSDEVRYIEDNADVSQGRLVLGYRCKTVLSDTDYYAMVLFNEIFGGSSVSKLFLNVREKKSLCYYCYSSFHTSTGTIKIGCGIDPSNKDEALLEIADQLNSMKSGDFTDSDIVVAKHTLLSGIRQIKDSPESIEASMLRTLLAHVSREPNESAQLISSVTKDEIVAAGQKVELDTVYFLNGNDEDEADGENE